MFLWHQNINISWTKLGYTRPTLFRNLPTLKYLDLRWNNLKHMHGKLILPSSFENLQLAGNPWNCSHSIKWILDENYTEFIMDRHLLLCAQKPYFNRPVLTVMQYKQVSFRGNCVSALSFHPRTTIHDLDISHRMQWECRSAELLLPALLFAPNWWRPCASADVFDQL